MKKLTFILTLIFSLMLVSVASASIDSVKGENKGDKTVKVTIIKDKAEIEKIRESRSKGKSDVEPLGSNPPTSTWNLNNSSYNFNTGTFWGSIYTNYKFIPYSDGTIYFDINGLQVVQGGYDITMYCSDGTSQFIGNFNELVIIKLDVNIAKTYYFKITERNNVSPYSGSMYGTIY